MTADEQPRDHAAVDEDKAEEYSDIEDNIKSREIWIRLLFMLIFFVLYAISRIVVFAVVVIQFFCVLLTGETNKPLKTLGHSFALYTAEIIDFMTFNREEKPFPFDSDWPV